MSKMIDINHIFIKTPIRISVDNKDYPITSWNIKVVHDYWETGDEKVLDRLKDFALDFS